MINGKQHTLTWHVDDLKSSHVDPKVNDEIHKWLDDKYGAISEVKLTRGKIHEYLGMTLDCTVKGQVLVGMTDYVKKMVSEYPEELIDSPKVASPWMEHLFKVNSSSPQLSPEDKELFHNKTAQGLFLCKRAQPDTCPAIAHFTTRVRNPNEDDKHKMSRMIKYLKQTVNDRLTLRSDGSRCLRWHVDSAFAVLEDFKSQTGITMMMGQGAVIGKSHKQSLNTRSLTESDMVGADDVAGPMIWAKNFLDAQSYEIKKGNNIMCQDNKSAILLEKNG